MSILRRINWGAVAALVFTALFWVGVGKAFSQSDPFHRDGTTVAVKSDTVYLSSWPDNALAATFCKAGEATVALRSDAITDPRWKDEIPEILAHEQVHVEQIRRAFLATKQCPKYSRASVLLRDEVEAYCAIRPMHMKRGYTRQQADEYFIAKVQNQFAGYLHPMTIRMFYYMGCSPIS